MAQSVRRLEQARYLERRANRSDGRSQLIVIIERGKAVLPVAADAGDAIEKRWADLTSPEELETLRHLLHHLLDRIGEADREAASRMTSIGESPLD
ncbi:hypothetical protein ABN034_11700 [Actinopolymorpha sp. B11F2]|uniref:hypothetical protein n=1 Tax=Actinopolymorpha sp. B11F2 TaxID=3160862 RepID=UPI0032E50F57